MKHKIADPHPAVEVAVTGATPNRGGVAHRRKVTTWTEKHAGQPVMRAAYAASCTGEAARSLSYGWADRLGAEICTHPKCYPNPVEFTPVAGRG